MIRSALVAAVCVAGAYVIGAGAGDPPSEPVPVKVVRAGDAFQLLRGGKPYFIDGVGGDTRLELLADMGGNSFRTWGAQQLEETRTGSDGVERSLLDHAQHLGLTVAAGFWMEHERHGYDYADKEFVGEQLARVGAFVRTYKDHPAILLWVIGNETETGVEDPEHIYRAINDAAKLVKSIDPDHPTMTVVAEIGDDKAAMIQRLCPDVDILGVNSYGGLPSLHVRLAKQHFDKPYVVAEYGPLGHWETGATPWGAPYEQTSSEKATFLHRGYEGSIRDQPNCLGGYAFLWGHKQERTATWYGMFLAGGERTESLDVLHEEWTGRRPENQVPTIHPIQLTTQNGELPRDTPVVARVPARDPDDDPMEYEWIVRAESGDRRQGGDREAAPPDFPELTRGAEGPAIEFTTPAEPGAYRLFVYVRDGKGGAATANVPFIVK